MQDEVVGSRDQPQSRSRAILRAAAERYGRYPLQVVGDRPRDRDRCRRGRRGRGRDRRWSTTPRPASSSRRRRSTTSPVPLRGALTGDAEVWCVDPLDGTTSFVHGFPAYSVSVALLRERPAVAGAVTNVPLAETVSAADRARRARQRPVRCCPMSRSQNRCSSPGFLTIAAPARPSARRAHGVPACPRSRHPARWLCRDRLHAHVAIGSADGFWEYGLQAVGHGCGRSDLPPGRS
jgi:hypothetical protein